ncbi:unnamed protein product [Caenorhabditis auriculariae]|uniref:Serpentine receptor class gamma n=1 Tax=Caenorhabditis auriculariae TaxID=2777116 RepID=A0A8S1HM35_9PELO|nr:unnamed protein product [Caenorhabditis auriculariae]
METTTIIPCDPAYSTGIEMIKFFVQFFYLFPTLIINIMISVSDALIDIIFFRLLIYIIPLCEPMVATFGYKRDAYWFTPAFFLYYYLKTTRYVIQWFISLNRMTCVVLPTFHEKIWDNYFWLCIAVIFAIPLAVTWNTSISKTYINNQFGGLSINYTRAVSWASLSNFTLILCSITFFVITISTGLILFGLKNVRPPNIPCDPSYDTFVELLKYFIQAAYLIPTLLANFLIIWSIMFSLNGNPFSSNAFFRLLAFDASISISYHLLELFLFRPMVYITPLCRPLVSAFGYDVSSFSYWFTAPYFLGAYLRAAKFTMQWFLSLNRMTCVILPTVHQKASLSAFMLGLCTLTFIIIVSSTIITICGMISMPQRLKRTEKNLCVVAFVTGAVMIFLCICQAFFASESGAVDSKLRRFIFPAQFLLIDIFIVSSPVMILSMSPALRKSVFRTKNKNSPVVIVSHSASHASR